MNALMVAAAIAGYFFVGGIAGGAFRRTLMSSCRDCTSGRMCLDGHQIGFPMLIGIFWPLAAPALSGVAFYQWLGAKESRAQKRELRKEADHKRKMAELEAQREMTMESVRFLVENGIKADVPGLYDVGGKS